jgi:hypothetical protein
MDRRHQARSAQALRAFHLIRWFSCSEVITLVYKRYYDNKEEIGKIERYSESVSSNSPRIGFARYRKVSGLFFSALNFLR